MTPPGGLVIVDKPAGLTSHDVVARIRRLAGTRRVGHAGTLDPMATGVLVVGVEKATRLLGHLALTEKEYSATIRLGQVTDSDDADGQIVAATSAAGVSEQDLRAAVAALRGEIRQVPPAVSAVKVGGKRAYKLTLLRRAAPASAAHLDRARVRRPSWCAARVTCSTRTCPSPARAAPTSWPWPATSAPCSAWAAT